MNHVRALLNQDEVIGRFLGYVTIDSESFNEKAMADKLVEDLINMGAEVRVDDTTELTGSNTGNVIGVFKGNSSAIPTIMLCAHMDTVMPGNGVKPIIDNGFIRSSGDTILGGDDKAGITAILEAVSAIKRSGVPHGDIEVVFTVLEEAGMHGAKNLDLKTIQSKHAFIFDSGGEPGEIIVKAPSQNKLFVTLKGKASHAGVNPEEGISAIQVAARAIDNMKLLRIDNETTANIGVITGGQVTNIVCPEVLIKGEVRSHNPVKLKEQTKHMMACFEEASTYFGAQCDIELEESYNAFALDAQDDIVLYTEAVMKTLELTPVQKATGGGSDTNIFNFRGLKAVTLGIGMKAPHGLTEHIAIESIMNSTVLAYGLIEEAGKLV